MKKLSTLIVGAMLCCIINASAQVNPLSFTASPVSGCTPLTVTFTNTSTDASAYEYRWDFGDGSPIVVDTQKATMIHIYMNKGNYTVSMKAYNVFGGYLGQYASAIEVKGLSSYDQLYTYPSESCPGQDVSFNAPYGFQTYIFNYGDGAVDTLSNNWKTHKYASAGDYIASVKILNVCNGSDATLSDTVSIKSSMPFSGGNGQGGATGGVYYSHYPNEACPKENVGFNAGYGYAKYIWSYGDGNVDTTTNSNTNHEYASIGTYSTSVKIINYCGNDTTLYDTVKVRYAPFPPVSLNINTQYGSEPDACPGEQLNFNAPWGYVYYVWNYGDGSPVDSGNTSYKTHVYSSLGTYTASVKIRQTCGNDTILYKTVNIKSYVPFPGWVSMSEYPDPACPFKEINFYGPWGYPGYQWSWGDGTPVQTTTLSYQSHTYTTGGTYVASVKVTNLCGNDTTLTDTVTINPNLPFPTGNLLSIGSDPSCPGNVNFSANSAFQYYIWNWGDGSSAQTTNTYAAIHSFPSVGNYNISVKLIDYCGKDTTVYDTLNVQYTPFPSGMQFNIYDDNSCPGEDINFNAPWGYVSYKWDFGDGNTFTGSNYVNHKYSSVGQYIATVKIKQLCGNDTTLSKIVKVINNQTFPNGITMSHYPNPACPGEPKDFYGPWGFASYIWSYGDGTSDTTKNAQASHTYSTGGNFSASLKVINYCGLDTVLTSAVQIDSTLNVSNGMLNAWFPNGTSACPGEMVNFNATYDYPYYTWNFGDGTAPLSGSFNFINHAYSAEGTFTASVTIKNYCGKDTTVIKTITIEGDKPIGMMPVINTSPMAGAMGHCPGAPITFSGPTGFASYVWNYGDGTPVDSTTSNSVTHSFSSPGNYTVGLKIINYCGNDTTATTSISINNTINPYTNINTYPNPICPNQKLVLKADTGFISYFWNFGDGFSAYGSNEVNHVYSTLGAYSASVIITNYCNISDTFLTSITVDTTTSFPSWMYLSSGGGGAAGGACPGEVVTLNTQPGFSSYFWNFGDGDTITTSGNSIGHTYSVAGTYSASVTINNGCGNSTTLSTSINISSSSFVNAPQIYTAQNAYCPGDAVMFLFNDWGSGAAQNYTYYWEFGDGKTDTTYGIGAMHVYDSSYAYSAVVTIINKCGNSTTKIVPVKINGNTSPTLNKAQWGTLAQTNMVGCPGDAVVFYFQGTGTNLWKFGDGSTGVASEEFINSKGILTTVIKHAYSSAGSYTLALTLTNDCGNSVTDSITIQIKSNLMVDGGLIVEPPVGANSYSTCRELNFVAYGGSSYQWNFGDGSTLTTISPSITHTYSKPGNYAVNVLITNGCGNSASYSDAISISQSGGPSIASITATNATCYGGNNGSAVVSVSGGNTPYTYLWNNAAASTASTATGLTAGIYKVIITDDNNCRKDTSITVSQANKIILSTSSVNTSCGGSSGSASVSITSGGITPFSYKWSNSTAATTSSVTGLSSDTYSVTVTGAGGCTATSMAAISENGGPTVAVSSITNVTCNGNSDGTATVSASGGTSPYTYLWDNAASSTAATVTGLSADSYSVTVSDSSGCKTVKLITVTEPDKLAPSITTTGTECGAATGSATVSVSGGTSSYTYLWDSNAGSKVTAAVTGLSANAYRVTITDSKGCSSVGVATINNTNAPTLSVSSTNVSCPGLTDGAIDLTVTKGTTPYIYIWTWTGGSSSFQDLSGLSAGVYTVMVQDASNCWIGTSVTLTAPSFSSNETVTNATCVGSSNGTASVTATGGSTPYTYLWSNAATTSSITGLAAATYTVQIKDTNNCTIGDTAVVSQPAALAITLSKTNVSCFGGSNGTAAVAAAGGTSPYSYLWNGGSTASAISVLNAGTYLVTVNDSCGTSKTDSIVISQPAILAATMSNTNVSCYGGGNGTATVTASGGTSPYNYSWNNGQTTSTASGIFPGIHSVNVFDANGCLKSNNITVTQPQALSATTTVSNVSCYAGNNGTAAVVAAGGSSPYTYLWNNSTSATTATATGLIAGTYSVTITDSCSASVTQSVQITQPAVLALTKIVSDVKCNGTNNGSASLTVSGGVTPYSYTWSNSATSSVITNLAPATYIVTVSDACAQTKTDSVLVNQPATLTSPVSKTNVSCNGKGDGTATVNASGGTSPYTYNWNNGQTTSTVVGLFPGNYNVNVVDINGCLASGIIAITQPLPLSATTSVTNVNCYAGNNGTATATAAGGTLPYSYLWNNSATTSTATGLIAGTYSVTITDSCNASVIQTVQITQPAVLSLSKIVSDVKCNGANNGSVSFTASGGVTPYSYNWSTGATSTSISGLAVGTYVVTVTDACAQTKTDSAIVSQPATLISAISKNNVSCNGSGDGTATVNASGGTSPYTYNWNNGQTTSSVVGLFPGNYNVNVVDMNGCLASGFVAITQPQPLSATTSVSYVSCFAGSNGTAAVAAAGGSLPYTYLWTNSQSTATATGLIAGTYSVTLTDSCGASVTKTVQITQPGALTLVKTVSDVKCNGANNGSVSFTASGGVTPYTYNWSTGATSATLSGLAVGTYSVTVSDACAQTKTDSVVVTQPAALTTTITKTNVSCNGLGDGTATVSASGGTSPYIYQWNNGQNTSTAVGLFAGFYSVNVFDANNCLSSNSILITQPQLLNVTVTASNATCGNSDANATSSVTGGTTPYTYLWSAGGTGSTSTGLGNGTINLTVTDSKGCNSTASAIIGTYVPTVDICIVSVDSSNAKNLIVWEKPNVNYIDSFRVYRDIVGTYKYIGSVDYADLSKFVDFTNGVNPSTTSYKYKISAVDTCGNESSLSVFHKTMHLTTNLGAGGKVNLIWDNYTGFTFNYYYRILRSLDGGTYSVLDSIANSNFTWTDVAPPVGLNSYLIEIVIPSPCVATKAAENHNTTRSNKGVQTLATPPPLTVSVTSVDVSGAGFCNGEATAIPSGGISPYTYLWTGGQTTATATGLCVGNYFVTITSSNGSTVTSSVSIVVTGIQSLIVTLQSLIHVFPNPSKGEFIITLNNTNVKELTLVSLLGQEVWKERPVSSSVKVIMPARSSGVYYLRVVTEEGVVNKKVVVE